MKFDHALATYLLLVLVGIVALSSCDLVLRQLGELPEIVEKDEKRSGERDRETQPAPSEGVMALDEADEEKASDKTWKPELFVIPEFDARREERREPSPLVVSADEELWVVVKPPISDGRHLGKTPARPALGVAESMKRTTPQEPEIHTEVNAVINGIISSVTVNQSFRTPRSRPVDIPYQCRLPRNAAVTDFVITMGERKIRGIVREREEAQEIYDLAKSRGLLVSLLQQEAPNTLSMTITNAAPNQLVEVSVTYVHTLRYADGAIEFVFPVAPPVADRGASDGEEQVSGDSGIDLERSGPLEISIDLSVDAGVPVLDVTSPTHRITLDQPTPERVQISLHEVIESTEREFVVRFHVASEQPSGVLFTEHRDDGRYFALMLFPGRAVDATHPVPLDVVFLVDCSRSMKGKPAFRAKQFVIGALEQLRPSDSFSLVTFAGAVWPPDEHHVLATRNNVARASRYVNALPPSDDENVVRGLETALATDSNPGHVFLVVAVTDGYFQDEASLLSPLAAQTPRARVFCVGTGSSVNRCLLEDIAVSGRGGVVYLDLEEDAVPKAAAFMTTVANPSMADLTVRWANMETDDVLPRLIPDLFSGRPVFLTGQYNGTLPPTITISGRSGRGRILLEIPVNSEEPGVNRPGIATIWARKRIVELIRHAMIDPSMGVLSRGRELSVEHRIVSPFASFIIVDTKSGD